MMTHYMTKRLVALQDLQHSDEFVPTGEAFYATPIDADYYIKHKRARDAEAVEAADEPATPDEPAAPRTRRAAQRNALSSSQETKPQAAPAEPAAPQDMKPEGDPA